MLAIKSFKGKWIDVTHRSGDVIRICVQDSDAEYADPTRVKIVFDDKARNFDIVRQDAIVKERKS
jgi:hypothetical protein